MFLPVVNNFHPQPFADGQPQSRTYPCHLVKAPPKLHIPELTLLHRHVLPWGHSQIFPIPFSIIIVVATDPGPLISQKMNDRWSSLSCSKLFFTYRPVSITKLHQCIITEIPVKKLYLGERGKMRPFNAPLMVS